MASSGLIFGIAVLWLCLAAGTAGHASAYGKRGWFWFIVVAITGIFGLVFYAISLATDTRGRSEDESVNQQERRG